MDIDVGTVIAGKYELVRLLGKGAMGEVWAATHNTLGGEFAVKLVETADDIEAETAAGRFQLEAQIAAKLSRRTRHIVSVSDHGEEGGTAYLVMELLEGESLETRVKRGGRLDLPEAAAIVMQVCRALSLAHDEGIFHRDLKPANIHLGKDEDGRLLVKLLDFGIARAVKPFKTRSPFATSKDMVLGTPSYMSPEQARGLDSLDHRCDLWALATCAYEALAQKIPFEGETVEDIFLSICTFRVQPLSGFRPDLAPEVEAFFAKAFAPKLDERFATAEELAAAFELLVDPASLEPFFGLSGVTPSGRRLPVAPISAPDVAAAPKASPEQTPARTSTAKLHRYSNPALESPTRSSGDPVPASIDTLAGVPKKRSGAFIAAGAIAALAVVGLGVYGLRGSPTKAANAAETTLAAGPSAKVEARNDVPPPPDTAPMQTTQAPPTPVASATVADTAPPPPPTTKGAHRTRGGSAHVAPNGPPTTAVAPVTAVTASPQATTPPAPAKKGPHDKDEVF